MLPLGATRAVYEGTKEPECRILFPGTYDRPDAVYQIVENAPEPVSYTHLLDSSVESQFRQLSVMDTVIFRVSTMQQKRWALM